METMPSQSRMRSYQRQQKFLNFNRTTTLPHPHHRHHHYHHHHHHHHHSNRNDESSPSTISYLCVVKTPTSGSTALPRERLVCVGVVSDKEMFFVRSEKEGELSLSSSTVIDRLSARWSGEGGEEELREGGGRNM